MAKNIKLGDVVRIKSGGPKMTVEAFPINETTGQPETEIVICVWFEDYKVIRDTFPFPVLMHSID